MTFMLELAGINTKGMNSDKIHKKAKQIFTTYDSKIIGREINGQAVSFFIARHPFTRLVGLTGTNRTIPSP